VFGFALGFGVNAICSLLIYLGLASSHLSKIPLWEQLLADAYYLSLLIWVGYLLKPEASPQAVHIPVTSPLLRWNEVAQQLGHSGGKVALFSPEPFLPQSERIVDRVLKEEFVERRRVR
jgi:hypothetical protein